MPGNTNDESFNTFLRTADNYVTQSVVPRVNQLVRFLQRFINTSKLTVTPYGSIREGTFLSYGSKICLDIHYTPPNAQYFPHDNILIGLCNRLQKYQWHNEMDKAVVLITDVVLVLQKTVQRPLMLFFKWQNLPVQVTFNNERGKATSRQITQCMINDREFRNNFLLIKALFRHTTGLLGPMYGQISTYQLLQVLRFIHTLVHNKSEVVTLLFGLRMWLDGKFDVFGTDNKPLLCNANKSTIRDAVDRFMQQLGSPLPIHVRV